MRLRTLLVALCLAPLVAATGQGAFAGGEGVAWSDWTPATFARAKSEGRVILVEVSAAWCHWCHVMERETYADPRVRSAIEASFLPVKVDADARPDLAERYAEYHWPATVFLTPDAGQVAALRGYRAPEEFLAILERVRLAVREGRTLPDLEPPAPAEAAAAPGLNLKALAARLRSIVDATWDPAQAGWGRGQKYPHAQPIEEALLRARLFGDSAARDRALRTLRAMETLIDPVDGGMYQYSEGGVWDRPHFERIMSVQAGAISAYADAYRLTRDPRHLDAAQRVHGFLTTTLASEGGAFLTSQDADVGAHGGARFVDGHEWFGKDAAARARQGAPRVDAAVYAQENGWAAKALVDLSVATGNSSALAAARRALERVRSTHADFRGGLRHAAGDAGPLHAGDTVAAGRACLALAQGEADSHRLEEAVRLSQDLRRLFGDGDAGGFFATTADPTAVGVFRTRTKPFETNAAAARFLIALAEATGSNAYRTTALGAIAAVAGPGVPERFGPRAAALLLAVEEATSPWTHATLVADVGDAAGDALWKALLAFDAPLMTRERVAPGEPSRAAGTLYPDAPAPAVYLCGDGRCAAPVTKAEGLSEALRSLR